MNAPFRFTTCRAGSEAAIKRDIATHFRGELTPAFMKPQFITWKLRHPEFQPPPTLSHFARVSGISLGLCKSISEIVDHARKLSPEPFRLHVFPRITPEDGVETATWQRIDVLEADIVRALQLAGIAVETRPSYAPGDLILDVIIGESDEEPFFVGYHEHHEGAHTHPGGVPRISLPDDVPSRAWLKFEQALAWRGWDKLDLRGQTALDLGCAPGGATVALLKRGMHVLGVDTGEMDPRVLQLAKAQNVRFDHWRTAAGRLNLTALPQEPALLLCDINLAPPEVLPHIARIQDAIQARRLILTLKLNTPALEDRAHEFIQAVRRIAPAPVFATQLAANRREICVSCG
ncbi:SAM-dependent methyltransferase [Prosthecobacter sp.]|jgi:23S rRNA (cytidine2498-2'-O)-methyltransferase|uniref:SAM-dependent methyltransferase n=1 Tax=Prosthecobacter sp. TaxID=1965333 RepID=UPI00378507A8